MTGTLAGLPLAELLVVAGSLALVLSRTRRLAARRRAAATVTVASAGMVVAGLVGFLSTSGLRWALLPVLAADLLVVLRAAVVWLRRRQRGGAPGPRGRRWPAVVGSLVCVGLVAAGGVAAWALPVPTFPRPSGESAVGTTVLEWTDPAREEAATPEAGDRRTVVVQLWYPAQPSTPGAPRAQYLGRTPHEATTVAAAAADYLGVPALVLDGPPRARSHAVVDAPPATGRLPVVLFSPGLGGLRTQSTAWAEDLASRGYVVAGIDHPYDSAAVVLADGRVVRTQIASSGDPQEDARRRIGWTTVRAADLGFVLTQLGRLDRGEIASPFEGLLDTGRAAAAGHSVGGAAAVRAAAQDPRFTAVIDLDGGLDPDQGPPQQPVLALAHEVRDEADAAYVARLSSVLARGAGTGYLLTVPGSAHLTFTDAPLYLPPVPSVTGSLGPARSVRTTAATCAAFLDATLRGRPLDLPATLSRFGDLQVHAPTTAPQQP
ncbi:alpha/beta hydrolase family protein [Cellulomonas sp. NPDC055163]